MARRKTALKFSGKTVDGKPVLSGIFKLYSTHGLPLVDIFSYCLKKDIVVDLVDFYQSAKQDGWNDETIFGEFREALTEAGCNKDFIRGCLKGLKDRAEKKQ